jgi:carbon starvation protein
MELLGWVGNARALIATAITLAGPLVLAFLPPAELDGKTIPLWRVFWGLFGSSNQLLAALTLLGLTVWLYRRGRGAWFTLCPAVLMLSVSLWSLGLVLQTHLDRLRGTAPVATVQHIEAGVAALLVVLAGWLVIEALVLMRSLRRPLASEPATASAV